MKMFVDVNAIYLHPAPVDFRNYAVYSVMCSNYPETYITAMLNLIVTAHNICLYILFLNISSSLSGALNFPRRRERGAVAISVSSFSSGSALK